MTETNTPYAVVLTTAGSEAQAMTIAQALVDRRLAGCVNIVHQVCSIYRFEGEVHRDDEQLLVIKTSAEKFPQVLSAIRELHSYENPEVVMLPIVDGSPAYLSWLGDCL